MRRNIWISVGLILVFSSLLFVTACQQNKVNPNPPVETTIETTPPPAEETVVPPPPEQVEDTREADLAAEREKARIEQMARDAFTNESLYFDFDNDALTPEAQEILRIKAEYLRSHPNVSVLIEGHCDERGTTEYNLALGDRRAESARSFLIDMGISASRMTKISYGEEMPVDPGHNEAAWSKNRRVHFTIE